MNLSQALINLSANKVAANDASIAFLRFSQPFEVNTTMRMAHFFAQILHETEGFRFLKELGEDAYFNKYEFRKDLGNTQLGDGHKYKGRGYFQITGRYNYDIYGQKLGVDLINSPEMAKNPTIAMRISLTYWQEKSLNKLADEDNIIDITKKINGGLMGLQDRINRLSKLKSLLIQ
jgi:putative chitinase